LIGIYSDPAEKLQEAIGSMPNIKEDGKTYWKNQQSGMVTDWPPRYGQNIGMPMQ
jgi:hypothetical protein